VQSKWKGTYIETVTVEKPAGCVEKDVYVWRKGNEMTISIFIFAKDKGLAEEFVTTLRSIAELSIRANFTPHSITMDGLAFNNRVHRDIWDVEYALGWSFEFVRSEENGDFTGELIATQVPELYKASETQVREFVSKWFAPAPHFTIPKTITNHEYSMLRSDLDLQISEYCSFPSSCVKQQLERSYNVKVGFERTDGDPQHYDLVGWLTPSMLKPEQGVAGLIERFEEAVRSVPEGMEDESGHDMSLPLLRKLVKSGAKQWEAQETAYWDSLQKAQERIQKKLVAGKKVLIAG